MTRFQRLVEFGSFLWFCIQYTYSFLPVVVFTVNFPHMTTTSRKEFSAPDAFLRQYTSSLFPYITFHPKTKKAITPSLTWSFAPPSLLAKFRTCKPSPATACFSRRRSPIHMPAFHASLFLILFAHSYADKYGYQRSARPGLHHAVLEL